MQLCSHGPFLYGLQVFNPPGARVHGPPDLSIHTDPSSTFPEILSIGSLLRARHLRIFRILFFALGFSSLSKKVWGIKYPCRVSKRGGLTISSASTSPIYSTPCITLEGTTQISPGPRGCFFYRRSLPGLALLNKHDLLSFMPVTGIFPPPFTEILLTMMRSVAFSCF